MKSRSTPGGTRPRAARTIVAASALGLAVALGVSCAMLTSLATGQEKDEPPLRWFKGNTHTHTLNSDGDSPPGEVAHWYRDHRYDFLMLSDHNYYTVIDELQRELDREHERLDKHRLLLIPGEEVTDQFVEGKRGYALHVNGIDTSRVVGAQGGDSVVGVLQRCIDAIHAAGGLPHVNHPNFRWSLTADDIYSLERLQHFEIYNGHPLVHNLGGGDRPSLEEMWDAILSRGRQIFGVAVDDAHEFQRFGPERSNPGRGWVVVRARRLDRKTIVGALKRGDFYCSTGVELETVDVDAGTLSLRIRRANDSLYRTEFIGRNGRVLAVDTTLEPSYTLREGDLYVRARVRSSGGGMAWTQAVFAGS